MLVSLKRNPETSSERIDDCGMASQQFPDLRPSERETRAQLPDQNSLMPVQCESSKCEYVQLVVASDMHTLLHTGHSTHTVVRLELPGIPG